MASRATLTPKITSATTTTTSGSNKPALSRNSVKRSAEDSLENEQRLSKRFDLLNIENKSKLWVHPGPNAGGNASSLKAKTLARSQGLHPLSARDEYMQVEDTKDRVYIHNLDEELDSDDDDETPKAERMVFLPDIERRLNVLPKEVFMNEEQLKNSASLGNELILYAVPSSLSVPREQDSVRKAIIESRARARQKQEEVAQPKYDAHLHDELLETAKHATHTSASDQQNRAASSHVPQQLHDDNWDAMDLG